MYLKNTPRVMGWKSQSPAVVRRFYSKHLEPYSIRPDITIVLDKNVECTRSCVRNLLGHVRHHPKGLVLPVQQGMAIRWLYLTSHTELQSELALYLGISSLCYNETSHLFRDKLQIPDRLMM